MFVSYNDWPQRWKLIVLEREILYSDWRKVGKDTVLIHCLTGKEVLKQQVEISVFMVHTLSWEIVQIAPIMEVNVKIQAPLYICILNIGTELSDMKTNNTAAIERAEDSNTFYKSATEFILIWCAKLKFHLTQSSTAGYFSFFLVKHKDIY